MEIVGGEASEAWRTCTLQCTIDMRQTELLITGGQIPIRTWRIGQDIAGHCLTEILRPCSSRLSAAHLRAPGG